jgi:hypothetical protein
MRLEDPKPGGRATPSSSDATLREASLTKTARPQLGGEVFLYALVRVMCTKLSCDHNEFETCGRTRPLSEARVLWQRLF